MIQTYNDIGCQVKQFETAWNKEGQLQKIYSSARYVSISLRTQGETVYLYFGRGKGYEGFWVGRKQIPSSLRKKDQFLEYLRKQISGVRLISVMQDPIDRIIYINYQKFGRECSLGLFYNARQLYFANQYYNLKTESSRLFKSWSGQQEPVADMAEAFNEVGRTRQDSSFSSEKITPVELLLEEEKKVALKDGKAVAKKSKFLKRKASNIQRDMEKNQNWPQLKEWIEKAENLEYLPSRVEVAGIPIKFKEKEHFKRRDEAYAKVKKLKKGLKILEQRLEETFEVMKSPQKAPEEKSALPVIRPVWKRASVVAKTTEDSREQSFQTYDFKTCRLGVGLSAQGNDQLRKSWANKEDWWFHLEEGSSPHVIAKLGVDGLVGNVFQKVAEILKKGAKLPGDEINLVYTQVKNLKGVPKKPGAVVYKKEKRVRIHVETEEL